MGRVLTEPVDIDYSECEARILVGDNLRRLHEAYKEFMESNPEIKEVEEMNEHPMPSMYRRMVMLSALASNATGPSFRSKRVKWKRSMRDHTTRAKRCGSRRFSR